MRKSLLLMILLSILTSSPGLGVEFSADRITQIMEWNSEAKFYFKDAGTHRTDEDGIVSIVSAPMVYQVFPNTKKYVAKKISEMEKDYPMAHYGDTMAYIKRYNLKQSGKETIQGYECVIYEGSIKGQSPHPTKIWYSKKLKNTLKQETNSASPVDKIVMTLENIKVGKLDKGLFEVPEGYTQVDSFEEGFGMNVSKKPELGEGDENGKEPSPDELKKIMELMRKQ